MPRIRKWLPLSCIRIDRVPLNRSTLALVDYIRNGGEVPPIKVQKQWCGVFNLRSDGWISTDTGHYEYRIRDGRHRYTAYKLLGKQMIEVVYGEPKTNVRY